MAADMRGLIPYSRFQYRPRVHSSLPGYYPAILAKDLRRRLISIRVKFLIRASRRYQFTRSVISRDSLDGPESIAISCIPLEIVISTGAHTAKREQARRFNNENNIDDNDGDKDGARPIDVVRSGDRVI